MMQPLPPMRPASEQFYGDDSEDEDETLESDEAVDFSPAENDVAFTTEFQVFFSLFICDYCSCPLP